MITLSQDQMVCSVQGSLDATTMDGSQWAGPVVKGEKPHLTEARQRVTVVEPGRGPKGAWLHDNGIIVVDRGGSNTADLRYYKMRE